MTPPTATVTAPALAFDLPTIDVPTIGLAATAEASGAFLDRGDWDAVAWLDQHEPGWDEDPEIRVRYDNGLDYR